MPMSVSSLKDLPVREKVFDPRAALNRKLHHTMTDDHTLFMIFQNKERVERGEKPIRQPWYVRMFK